MGFRTNTEEHIDFSNKIDAILQEDDNRPSSSGFSMISSLDKFNINTERVPALEDLTEEEKQKILEAKTEHEEKRANRLQKSANVSAHVNHVSKIAGFSVLAFIIRVLDFIGRVCCVLLLPKTIREKCHVSIPAYDKVRSKIFIMRKLTYRIASLFVKFLLWSYIMYSVYEMYPYYIFLGLCMIITFSQVASKRFVKEAAKTEMHKSVSAKQISARDVSTLTDKDVVKFYGCIKDGRKSSSVSGSQEEYHEDEPNEESIPEEILDGNVDWNE